MKSNDTVAGISDFHERPSEQFSASSIEFEADNHHFAGISAGCRSSDSAFRDKLHLCRKSNQLGGFVLGKETK